MLCEQDHSLIRRETTMPGFGYLLDAERLASLLEASGAFPGSADLEVGYLRYKPGVSCIARFEFPFEGEKCFGYAKAFDAGAESKLLKARQKTACAGPLGPGRLFLAAEKTLVNFLPNDQRLRSLCRLADADGRADLLSRIFKDQEGWQRATFRPLNYKPERRYVAKVTRPDGGRAVVKFFTPDEFEWIRKYRKRLLNPENVCFPRWIGGSKAHSAMAFSWIPGSAPGLAELRAESSLVSLAGEALARFHSFDQPGLRRERPKRVVNRLRELARELAHLMPELKMPAAELATTMAAWWIDQANPKLPIHGDFYHRQIIAGGGTVALIDSDNARLGEPLTDIGNFIAHLERAAGEGDLAKAAIPAITEALCDGYRGIRARQDLSGLHRHTAFCLFHLLHDPFRERSENWPQKTAALLQRCRELFSSGTRGTTGG